ncbi:glycosyltransferase family 2 protein [Desulfomicrobium escambiense]|uniref:glycosyltransferase family 2 protein n=1 Tax=Desulfomicrobium escambiense TaxID=29503 RepID=UPI000A00E97A|nr:glycosyltransferase family 2 protein [Desulfomicrobium escambiense]
MIVNEKPKIAVVIPCYNVRKHILDVVAAIGPEVFRIYVVDDCCPYGSGSFLKENTHDERVVVIRHDRNRGVGAAVMTGYQAAIDERMEVIVKIDGDGQMDPSLIAEFVLPIIEKEADYTKGNRFFNLESVKSMPKIRLFGNAILSFMTKLSSGYWNLFDPTNGYTAIHADVAKHLPFSKISKRYFFETDMLFRLNTLRAVVLDVPMVAKYADEVSGLKISKIAAEFMVKHLKNFLKRLFYNYYLRDLSLASIELPIGLVLLTFGAIFGGYHWINSASANSVTSSGTVMLAALPVLMGIQFILAFLGHDISSVPTRPISRSLQVRALCHKMDDDCMLKGK